MSRPNTYLAFMAGFVALVATGAFLFAPALKPYFLGNPAVNGVIVAVMLAGIVYIFRQVILLYPEIAWMERFRRTQGNVSTQDLPRLLTPMATMLAGGRAGRVSLSAVSLRTLLDGIASRLDESREISRYLIGVLVFLGLLGTFYGLLETVQSVKGVLGGLSLGGSDVAAAFAALQSRLETPLSGMSTAFSASLFGLSGSLVLGFLDLQAGLALNRFYSELEEILSGYTRLSGGGSGAVEMGEASVPAYIQALLEQTADGLENLQRIMSRGEEGRIAANAPLHALAERLTTLTDQMRAEQALLLRLAEQQLELRPVLQRIAESTSSPGIGEEARGHLRNIEIYLARMSEDLTQGRGELVQEMRSEIRLLTRTIAALAEEAERS
ncbi:MAG TPA: flagellar motor protein MotA [Stellaceae bacterium]|nr:flagellar motor protein MotA [Stellaceae bacterium]